jgi:hypothetical protein
MKLVLALLLFIGSIFLGGYLHDITHTWFSLIINFIGGGISGYLVSSWFNEPNTNI